MRKKAILGSLHSDDSYWLCNERVCMAEPSDVSKRNISKQRKNSSTSETAGQLSK